MLAKRRMVFSVLGGFHCNVWTLAHAKRVVSRRYGKKKKAEGGRAKLRWFASFGRREDGAGAAGVMVRSVNHGS